MIINWIEITKLALIDLWQGFLNFIPSLIGAVIIFIIGWFIATWVGKIISEILRKLKINNVFEKGGWKQALLKAELKVDVAEFIGAIAKWILVIVFLRIVVDILGWEAFAIFLGDVLVYLPNVIIAILIFVVTAIIVDIVEKIVKTGVEGIKAGYGQMAGVVAKWSVWVFAILAILQQLKFDAADWVFELIKITFMGIVAMVAIAFGLGGKDVAAEILQDLKKKLKE